MFVTIQGSYRYLLSSKWGETANPERRDSFCYRGERLWWSWILKRKSQRGHVCCRIWGGMKQMIQLDLVRSEQLAQLDRRSFSH
jgi:hypothetical protein